MKPKTKDEAQEWIIQWLEENAGVTSDIIDINKPFAEYHLDSLTSVEMSYDLEEWSGKELSVTTAWNYPTIDKMSEYLSDTGVDKSLDSLLTEIENMTEKEVEQKMRST